MDFGAKSLGFRLGVLCSGLSGCGRLKAALRSPAQVIETNFGRPALGVPSGLPFASLGKSTLTLGLRAD